MVVPGGPCLSPEAALRRYRDSGERGLRNAVVEQHRWLAVTIARQYRTGREPLEDLVQVALVALVKAADRFDPDYGAQFKSYAAVTVRGELRRHFRDATWAVHVPRRLQELRLEIRAASEVLDHRLGRSPTTAELAEHLHVDADEIIAAIAADRSYQRVSIDERWSDRLASQGSSSDETFGVVDASDAFRELVTRLPARLRRIVEMRFVEELTQAEIAAAVGVSQVQISRLLRQAIDRLRQLSVTA
jgi:RNA polymerase sigma-B factor